MNLTPNEILILLIIFSILQNFGFDTNIKTPIKLSESQAQYQVLNEDNIIYFTNKKRKENGLTELKKDEKLSRSAFKKAVDIIKYQKFDHILPDGKTLEEILKENNYDPLFAGENLLIGNLLTPEEIVDRLFESPRHRENILSKKYKDIGVGIYKGIYHGKEMIVVVQHFGLFSDFCKKPNEDIKKEIDYLKEKIDSIFKDLNNLRIEIDNESDFYLKQNKITKFNNLVDEYNNLVIKVKSLIQEYNNQVEEFNNCLKQFE